MTRDDRTHQSLTDVIAELLEHEPIFHRREFGTTREAYLAQTADDFWEVGASGGVYDREFVIGTVVRRADSGESDRWSISDTRCRRLATNTYAFTYRLDQGDRITRRLTLWRRDRDGWRALYHQGTIVQGGPATAEVDQAGDVARPAAGREPP